MTTTEEIRGADVVVDIPLALIDFDPENTGRDDIDDDEVEDVRERGIDTPIAVTAEADGRYKVIYGERRTRMSLLAGRDTIPAVIKAPADEADRIEMQGVENFHRKPPHPLDEGHLFCRLSAAGRLQQQIADRFAKGSQPYVSKRQSLWRNLTDDAKQLFRDGRLNVREAEAIAQLHDRTEIVTELLDIARDSEPGPNPHIPEWKVRGALDDQARAKAVESARKKLTKAGVRILTDDEYRADDVYELGNETIFDVDVDPEAHAAEPCHAAHVDQRGEVALCCTDNDRHRPSGESALKANNLRDIGDTIAGAEPEAEPDQAPAQTTTPDVDDQPTPPEAVADVETAPSADDTPGPDTAPAAVPTPDAPDRNAEIAAAAPSRLNAIRAAVRGNRSQAYANLVIRQQLVAGGWGFVDLLADLLVDVLDIDHKRGEPSDAIRSYVDAGGDNPIRFVIAFGLSMGERRLGECVEHDEVEDLDRRALREYFDEIEKHGHQLLDAETALLAGPPIEDLDAATRMREVFDGVVEEAEKLRNGPARGKKHDAQVAVLDVAKADFLAAIANYCTSPETFARTLHALDLADWLMQREDGYADDEIDVEDDDRRQHTAQLATAFADAGVPIGDDVDQVVRGTHSNRGAPTFVHIGEIVDVLGVDLEPNRDERGPWTADHSCPTCDAHKAQYGEDVGPTPAANYTWPSAPYLNVYAWSGTIGGGFVGDGADGKVLLESVDTRDHRHGTDEEATDAGDLWYRARCSCGFIGDAHIVESAAFVDALDHAWPTWRTDSPVVDRPTHNDSGKPIKGAPEIGDDVHVVRTALCEGREHLCRGAISFYGKYGGKHVVCTVAGHHHDEGADVEPEAPAEPDMPRAYTGTGLTRVRLDALRVLAFADATAAFTDVRLSTRSTTEFEGDDVELLVLSQAGGWLIDNGLAERTSPKAARITDVGRQVARDEDVLAGIETPNAMALDGPVTASLPDNPEFDIDPDDPTVVDTAPPDETIDVGIDDTDPLAAVAAGFIDARDRLEASGKGDRQRPSLISRASDARDALAATLVLRYPNREELAGALQALIDDVDVDPAVRHGELVAVLEQAGPIGTVRQLVRVDKRPKTRVGGLLRDVYVEDLVDALDENGGVDLATIADWQATNWPDIADQTDDEAVAWFNDHYADWGPDGARIAYLVETANAGVAWDHRPRTLIAIRSRIAAKQP